MDPATIFALVSSAVSLATLCGSAAKDLKTQVSKYKNAKLAILSMVQGLDTMQLAWSRIGNWAQNQAPAELLEEDDFIGRLRRSLETGSLVMNALNEELLIYKPSKMGLTQRTKVVWNEGTLRIHQERIRDQALSMTLLLQAIHLPTLGDRNNLLRESEEQFGKSDESAYSIVPSRMSMSIHTGHTIDSGASKSEVDLVYKPLTFENELFTARVYKRNYRTPALQRLFKGTAQKTSDSTRPRTVAQKVEEDPDGSEDENLTIREPGPTAGIEDSIGGLYIPPSAEPHLSFAEARNILYPGARILFAEACEQGDVEIIESFLASGRDVHAPLEGSHQSGTSFPDLSAIHFAAKGGQVQVVGILLSYGANKEMPTRTRRKRPLHLAVEGGHVGMVRYLLDNGTNIAASDGASAQAIHEAAACGSTVILSLLLDRGAAIDSAMTNGDQPLHIASLNPDRANVIRFLCSQGADIEAKTHRGYTPLYYASVHNHVDNMKALLELGAAHSPQGPSMLGEAVKRGYLQATRLLLERGLDPNCPVYGERTALRWLVHVHTMVSSEIYRLRKYADVLELLLENGAEVDLQDSNGDTPLHNLCTRRVKPMSEQEKLQLQLATILLRSTRDVDMVNFAGETALGLSMKKGESGYWLSQSLIDSGARLLVSKPAIELRLELEQFSGHLYVLNCHVRRDSNAWTKSLGYYEKDDQDSLARLNSRSLGELRQLLRDQGIYNGSK
ncbi:hypothetical protein JMJ35_000639 [Cladonia borealis]|uniref:Ankyrin n=1 Tax=Cladonia borealis TaxID=184061 RepID=A0AA39V803_9LECA|nr:hypothetical protein JMJ35_000639 [Cladonia borealis]